MTRQSVEKDLLARLEGLELGMASMLLHVPERCAEVAFEYLSSESLRPLFEEIQVQVRDCGGLDLSRLAHALPKSTRLRLSTLLRLSNDSSELSLLEMMEVLERRHTSAAHFGPTIEEHRRVSKRLRAFRLAERVKEAAADGDVPSEILGELAACENGPLRGGVADVVSFDEVEPEDLTWLFPGVLPRKKLVTLMGDPGVGKGLMWIDYAARITTGQRWPCGIENPNPPSDVVVLSSEDGLADTLVPRFIAAGGDRSRMKAIRGVRTKSGGESGFSLDRDLAALEGVLASLAQPALVVIDPVGSYVGKANTNTDAEVRAILSPLGDVAERYGVTVLLVVHMNKKEGVDPSYRAMGSLAFTAVSRMVWALAKDRDDSSGDRRLLVPIKANVGRGLSSYAFEIAASNETAVPSLKWETRPLELDPAEVLSPRHGSGNRGRERDDAKALLRELLREPMPAREVFAVAGEEGVSEMTLRRAAKDLNVRKYKDGMEGGWFWSLLAEQGGDDGRVDDHHQPSAHPEGETDHLRKEVIPFGQNDPPRGVRDGDLSGRRTKVVTPSIHTPSSPGSVENGFEYADEIGGGVW